MTPWLDRTRAFRGEFAAASLKRRTRQRGPRRTAPLPRRIRRGLIEASNAPLPAHSSPPFRGEFAAASLKLLF